MNAGPQREGEAGYILMAVLFLLFLFMLALAIAAPQVAASIRRDRETELIHRGEQYKRAIQLYYRRFGAYPSSIDQLVNTNNMRFLRKRYTDPITGKDDWKLVHFGQAHVKVMGFFNKPVSGGGNTAAAGGSVMGGGVPGMMNAGGGMGFGGQSGALGGSAFGSAAGTGSPSGTDGTGTASSGGNTGSGSSFGSGSGFGSGFGSGPGSGRGSGSGFGSSGSGSNLSGGAPIVGVVIPDTHASLREYKTMKRYNEWEFVYDSIEEMQNQVNLLGGGGGGASGSNVGTGGAQSAQPGSPLGGGFGAGFGAGSGPSGGTGGFGSNPPPQQPQ